MANTDHPSIEGLFEVPVDGIYDEAGAELAPVAGLNLGSGLGCGRPTWFVIRSWDRELRLYRKLARHLGPDQPIVTIGPPRGDGAGRYPRSVEQWRDLCLSAARPLLEASPRVVLGGWSFGGVLALELGRQLQSEGRRVELITMLDTRLPTTHPRQPVDGRLAGATHAVARHTVRLLERAPHDRLAYVRERAGWHLDHRRRRRRSGPRTGADMPPLQTALWTAYLKYEPRPCDLPVAQLWSAESRDRVGDSMLGWAPYLRGPLCSAPIPGDHLTIFDDPNGAELARALDRSLDRSAQP